jgi:CheY-like chemotaxis protein
MILVAEDNDILRELHLRQLSQLGFSGDSAASGLEVLECISRRRYDLILMDIKMPDMDGFEAARMIRLVEMLTNTPHTPVIAVTGVTDFNSCMSEGLDDYMAKPIMLDNLRTVLSRWISMDRAASDKDRIVLDAARTVIKARREALGLSKLEVARKSGYTEEYIDFLESGSRDFDLETLARMSTVLDIRIAELVTWIELVARERDIL